MVLSEGRLILRGRRSSRLVTFLSALKTYGVFGAKEMLLKRAKTGQTELSRRCYPLARLLLQREAGCRG